MLINSNDALLDLVTINNFAITDVNDLDNLLSKKIAIWSYQHTQCSTISGDEYTFINIEDDIYFKKFFFGTTKFNKIKAELVLAINEPNTHNLNCISPHEIRLKLEQIKIYLLEHYGISVDFSNAEYKSIELNKTFSLNECYERYARPLQLISSNYPAQLRLTHSITGKKNNRTYYCQAGKEGLKIKIYNKSFQLKKKYNIDTDKTYLRYEITLPTKEKIKRELGTAKVNELTQELINTFFTTFIQNNVKDAYIAYSDFAEREVKKIIKNYIYDRKKAEEILLTLKNLEINGKILILQLTELNEIIDKNAKLFKSKQSRYYVKKSIKNLADVTNSIFLNNDKQLLTELFAKLTIN